VYVVGEVDIGEELELLGFQHLGGPEDSGKVCMRCWPALADRHVV
jgi:hypothetical protein